MEAVSFVFGDRATVPGFLGSNVQDEIIKHILDMDPDRVMVITDSQVDDLHKDFFAAIEGKPISGETGSASAGVKLHKMILPCGDACKAWVHLQDLVNWNFECGATRRSVVVAFGGGAIINVTGLFASIVLRGMKLAYVPTTFLAMHDVVTSLKTSICHYGCKNNIGTFYAPNKILIDTAFCHSLPMGELFSGLGELTKNAALFGGEHREGLTAALSKELADGEAFSLDSATLENLTRLGIKAKMDLLATDAYEKNYGIIFEYGHTLAHAFEKAYGDGVVPHGVAVVYGMLFSAYAAEKLGYMSSEDHAAHDKICKLLTDRYPLPQPLPSIETIIKRAMKDNKRGMAMESDDEIADILLYKVGSIVPSDTHMLVRFPRTLVVEYLESAGFPHQEEEEAADAHDDKADVAMEQSGEETHQSGNTGASAATANMEAVSFVFGDRATIPGFLGSNVQDEILKHILDMNPDRVMVVTDSQVDDLHKDYFAALEGKPISGETWSASTGVKVHKMVLPCGDACKAWVHLQDLVNWNFECGATRRSVVVAFGGGAIINVTGLFASIVLRGMKLAYVPTTFLAMHDVVTSLKTSICHYGCKNNIGTFYAPDKILIDTAFCHSLPMGELFSGLGELTKNAALFGGEHREGLTAALSREFPDGEAFSLDSATLENLTRLGIKAKMDLLATDAYEKNYGIIFEYGHTIAHALEKAYGDGVVPHGVAVVYGMLFSSYAAEKLGYMSSEERVSHDKICKLLTEKYPLPQPLPSIETVIKRAMKDNKRGMAMESDDEIADILLYKVGSIVPSETHMLIRFPRTVVVEYLESVGFPHKDEDEVADAHDDKALEE